MRSPALEGQRAQEERYILDDQVGFVLRQAQQRHTTIFAAEMIEGLTPTQWAALAKLREVGDCSQNHLGRLTAMDAATIKGVIDRLTGRGFTDGPRPTIRDDRGARVDLDRVALTPHGLRTLYDRAARDRCADHADETLEPLDEERARTLIGAVAAKHDIRASAKLQLRGSGARLTLPVSGAAQSSPISRRRRRLLRRRRVAAAVRAHDSVDDGHADARQIAEPHAIEQRLARRMLGAIHEDEIGGASDLDKPAVERPHARRVAGRKAEGDLGGNVAERSEQRDHAQDAERLNARAGRGVGAEDDAAQVRRSSLAVRKVNSAARSLPLWTSSRPRLQPSHRQTI